MEPFIGEIRLFGGDFAPRGWALCDGTLLSINQYHQLFTILQTYYGGDGMQNFALPDLRGRAAIGMGQGHSLSGYGLGQKGGAENVILTVPQMPAHSHIFNVHSGGASQVSPADAHLSDQADPATGGGVNAFSLDAADAKLKNDSISATGGSQPVGLLQPYQVMNYIIALEGIYPSRP